MSKKYYSIKPTLQKDIGLMVEVTDEAVNEIRADVIDEFVNCADSFLMSYDSEVDKEIHNAIHSVATILKGKKDES